MHTHQYNAKQKQKHNSQLHAMSARNFASKPDHWNGTILVEFQLFKENMHRVYLKKKLDEATPCMCAFECEAKICDVAMSGKAG